ncbi:hypothetical protein [Streptomyces sp. NPDC058726]|uniref:hypothetical protein n=1 Tax=Streptomyces sp. NPDC058726 TaxID=3346611 RepID=UPI0036901808
MTRIKRTAKQAGGLLIAFAIMRVSACRGLGGPSKRELRKLATSAEVQTNREATEKDVRERVRAIETGVPWLKPLSVVTYDQCQDVRGNSHLFDPNPPKNSSMICRMSAYIFFSTDRNPKEVVTDIRRSGVTEWTESSVNKFLTYYGDDNGLQLSDRYIPSLTSYSEGGTSESLHWDTGKEKVSANFPQDALWERYTYRYSEKSVDRLRQENGIMYMWSLHANAYHTAS